MTTPSKMNPPWTETRIGALATDAGALRAARELAARWRAAGHAEGALWGLCASGGGAPYETVVDLTSPAYRCSCPSRKVPCKHALSLLLRWSAGAVDESAEVPEFAAGWLSRRAARTPRENTARTPDPATVAQRRGRVTAGLEELDIWLGDQVRTGLAQVDRSYRAFETIAARMVDAQAPAVATALRQIPTTIATRADWPDLVLGEYARLHLLIAAHRRLDDLPDGLAASVRTHIGYSTSADSVRAEPPLRDHWMALGSRTTEEERLHTRRTWLHGRHTRRPALVVEHSFGAPDFARDVPAPGSMIDAALHFYPAAAPLRALWGDRHGPVEPFTTLPRPENAGGPVADALRANATALAADPWLRSWPVILHDVVPVVTENNWRIVDSTGDALDVAPDEQPWKLLGTSGGYPVTLLAEWTAAGLLPISALVAGEILDVTGDRTPVRTDVATEGAELTSAALLGTARRNPDPSRLAPPVAAVVRDLHTDPPLALLESAALRDAFARAGATAGTAQTPPPAGEDQRRRLPTPAARRLATMLGDNSHFLPEWFEAATPFDYRAPDALCALLLEHATASTRWRPQLLRLAGARAHWLASKNPQWRAMDLADIGADAAGNIAAPATRAAGTSDDTAPPKHGADADTACHTENGADLAFDAGASDPNHGTSPADTNPVEGQLDTDGTAGGGQGAVGSRRGSGADSDVWRFGGARARADWLAELRRRDPDSARHMVVAAWAKESGASRAELLATFEAGISAADEAFLDAALDDRRSDVRRAAAGLLALLPDSAFARRMVERAATWIRPIRLRSDGPTATSVPSESGATRVHLVVDVPDPLDAAAARDGIIDRAGEFTYRWAGAPDRTAGLLRQLVAATPLRHWATGWGASTRFSPQELTGVGIDDRFRQPLFDGWVDAALAQRDPHWARALFDAGVPSDTALLRRRELFALLPAQDRTRHLLRLDGSWLSEIEALLPALDHPWPDQFAHHLIRLLFERAVVAGRSISAHGASPAAHRSLLNAAAVHLPVTAAPAVESLAHRCEDPAWQHAFERLARDLNHRSIMLEELQ
ncbi:DUF5691 domain-containing protein [Nocardia bovistercoris]|uniref:DUF5691 domain-containing protein n=1 Tax=Nocardia bovistercoris TaxID=2785916 RepID=UPI001E39E320|nr:DUF5691 domain-containing protein [Nocardia bovistercoris]